jgi:hypothetical protein
VEGDGEADEKLRGRTERGQIHKVKRMRKSQQREDKQLRSSEGILSELDDYLRKFCQA